MLSLALSMLSLCWSCLRLASGAFRGCFGRLGLCTLSRSPPGCAGLGAGVDGFLTGPVLSKASISSFKL